MTTPRPLYRWWLFCLGCELWFSSAPECVRNAGLWLIGRTPRGDWFGEGADLREDSL